MTHVPCICFHALEHHDASGRCHGTPSSSVEPCGCWAYRTREQAEAMMAPVPRGRPHEDVDCWCRDHDLRDAAIEAMKGTIRKLYAENTRMKAALEPRADVREYQRVRVADELR